MQATDMGLVPVAHREPPLWNSRGVHTELAVRTVLRLTTADAERVVGRRDWLPNKPRW